MKSIKDIDVKNKNILVRVDYNVPLANGKIVSDFRIRASLPTIKYLLENGAKKIILISHLGRPEGKASMKFSLEPIAKKLEKLLNKKIGFYNLPKQGKSIFRRPNDPSPKIILFENLRFDPGEELNDQSFIKNIIDSVNADLFVQDGFAVVHRAHASTDAIKNFLPIYAGLLLKQEIEQLKKVIDKPEKPLLLILGGAKVEDKQPLIDRFSELANKIIIGGKIAADGFKSTSERIYIAEDFDEDATGTKLDVGPFSTAKISNEIAKAKTIIWNGLLGKAEDPAFATSSIIVAEILGDTPDKTTIVCGGDTTGFVEKLQETHPNLNYSLVSTGGGAALEFLLGNPLPGLTAIKN